MTTNEPLRFILPETEEQDRADKVLANRLTGTMTRSTVARLIRKGLVTANDLPIRPSTILSPGDEIVIQPEPPAANRHAEEPVPDVAILYEDDHVIVVDKPAGLVVHPGAGRPGNTLMDLLTATRPSMVGVGEPGRWGIVHRLDRDTSGVMVVAKTAAAHESLTRQFRDHSVHRIYVAIVRGVPGSDEGRVDAAIGRHVKDGKRISLTTSKPRHAVSRWRVVERMGPFTLMEVTPETGRTHQIRVHLASVGLPVLGDQVYGKSGGAKRGRDLNTRADTGALARQALHATVLGFEDPVDGSYREFSSRVPGDMQRVIAKYSKQIK
jgi:23S rRNA pseudouridine1911/1915/1917 synthase